MPEITEIIEESKVQLIVEGQDSNLIEVVDNNKYTIEVVDSLSTISNDLDIETTTNTLIIDSVSDDTVINITGESPNTLELTTLTNVVEILEPSSIIQQGSVFNITNVERSSTVETSSFSERSLTASFAENAGITTSFQTQSNTISSSLTNLVIKDFSNDVSVNVNNGNLELVFGSPSLPTMLGIDVVGFDTNRFDLIQDTYTLNPNFNLNGTTFVKGMLSSSTTGIAEFFLETPMPFTISDSQRSTYSSGSHSFTAKVITQLADATFFEISTDISLNLDKLNPSDPIRNVTYNLTPTNAYNDSQDEIEKGAIGTILYNIEGGSANGSENDIGWINGTPQFSIPIEGTLTIDSTTTSVIAPSIDEHWNSGDKNSTFETYTGSLDSRTWNSIVSLRYGTSIIEEFTEEDLLDLPNWENSIGTIEYGKNTISEIESVTLSFAPNQTTGEFLYIIYSSTLNDISKLINQDSLTDDFLAFDSPIVIGDYKIFRTITKKDGSFYQHKITF